MHRSIITKPPPFCDDCGVAMTLRRPRLNQHWEPFWGCSNYPECTFTLDIGDDGKPIRDLDDPIEHLKWE